MIFCFSATGNTLFAAKRVSNATGDYIINISGKGDEFNEYELKENESVGFFFPVHGWRPPKNVLLFIKNLTIKNYKSNYCYSICTAGDTVGEAIDILNAKLKERGFTLNSAFSLIMPESYVGLPFMNVDNPSKEKLKINQSKSLLSEYISQIISKEINVFRIHRGKYPKINSRILGAFFHKKLVTDNPFKVVEQRCIKCGKCKTVCPTEDIDYTNQNIPYWKHNGFCLVCFKCYHHCPTHAIEYGRRTKNKGQYFYKENE